MTNLPPTTDHADPPGDVPWARPMSVEPIGYATPVGRRPGVLTAVGVMSLVLAVLYLLTAVLGGFSGVGFLMVGRMIPPAARVTVAPLPPPPAAPTGPTAVRSTGAPATNALDPTERAAVVDGIGRRVELTPEFEELIDLMLQQPDVAVVARPADGSPIDAAAVAEGITEVNVTKAIGSPDRPESMFFSLPNGRLILSGTNASFVATDGSQAGAFANTLSGGFIITARAIGKQSSLYTVPPAGTPAPMATAGTAPPAATPTIPPFPRPSVGAVAATLVDAALRVGLAGWLFVAGVLVLRDSPRGRPWHVRWAWVKIPTAVLGAVAYAWLMSTMMGGLMASMAAAGGTAGAGASPGLMYGVWGFAAAVQAVFACIYPIVVLVIMHGGSARDYYAARG